MALISTSSPVVHILAQTIGAIGGLALVHAALGTTTVITTSYLAALLIWITLVLAHMVAIVAGTMLGGYVSDKAFNSAGQSVGESIKAVRGWFSPKAAKAA